MLASSRKPCGGANPRRRAKTPALQSRREWAATHKRRPSARPAGGPGASPEGYSQGKVPHPSVAWGDTSPCRGGFIGGSPPKASPARGGGCAARRRRRGALPVGSGGILQGPAGPCPTSVGDDAGIVPEPLRYRKAPGGGRERPPYKTAASGQQRTNASHPPGPLAGRCKRRPLRRGAAGCRLPVPLPRVRHMVGRAISPAANPSAAANLSGGRERPLQDRANGNQNRERQASAWANTGQAPAKIPPALPPFCAAAHFYGILKVRTCQKYLYPI